MLGRLVPLVCTCSSASQACVNVRRLVLLFSTSVNNCSKVFGRLHRLALLVRLFIRQPGVCERPPLGSIDDTDFFVLFSHSLC
jgi:hypothetical protein